MDPSTVYGPLVDERMFNNVMRYLDLAGKDHLKILVGGKGDRKALSVQPTIIFNPPKDHVVWTDEIYGPVCSVRTFKTEEQLVEMVNDTPFGLAVSIYTKSLSRLLNLRNKFDVGWVTVNKFGYPIPQVGWGGTKQSGYGREGGLDCMKEYMNAKTVTIS